MLMRNQMRRRLPRCSGVLFAAVLSAGSGVSQVSGPGGLSNPEDFVIIDDMIIKKSQLGSAPLAWPGGVVPFEFDGAVIESNRQKMRESMDLWNYSGADVTFVPATPGTQEGILTIFNDPGSCFANVGYDEYFGAGIWAAQWCFDWPIGLAHELSHTLGFWHEQSRPDRDLFVTVNDGSNGTPNNIEPGAEHNFFIHSQWIAGGLGTAYDYDSMMHYHECAFTVCSPCCETIVAPQPIGQGTFISDNDIEDMENAYGIRTSSLIFTAPTPADGSGAGTLADPLHSAVLAVTSSTGSDPHIYFGAGTYDTTQGGPLVIDKPLTLHAAGGAVTLE